MKPTRTNDYGFEVTSIASSNAYGTRIDTLELKYPRFIHAEFMTHRVFSRNASSSRAIPVEKMIEAIEDQPAMPIHWGANQKGMQAENEHSAPVKHWDWGASEDDYELVTPQAAWYVCAEGAASNAQDYVEAGYHKQVVNRILEPYSFIKVIVTATEWDNFFALRLDPDAQPEIQELARMMKEVLDEVEPKELDVNDWHVPYYHEGFWQDTGEGLDLEGNKVEVALGISTARCARVSYRLHDGNETTFESDMNLAAMLKEDKHMSPFEHQASPMGLAAVSIDEEMNLTFEDGVTHFDRLGVYWSGNFRNWVQHRQMKQYKDLDFRGVN